MMVNICRSQVWALVRWYWSGTDIHNECKQLDTSSFGKYERCLSEYRDIVDILCINGRAKVLHYKDEAPDQQIATSNQTFYVRRAFDFAKSPPIFHPMPALHCICKKPYNPDKSGTMYYCPKPSCKTWWHTACLDAQQAVHEGCDQEEQWHIHLGELLNSSFDLDEQFMSMLDSHDPEQRASLREKSFITPAMLTHIPKDIVDAAQHQIRRGGDFGVVGNVRIVTRARQFVARYYRAIWGNNLGFDQQVKTLQQEIDETKVLRMVGADRQKAVDSPGKPYYCPDCSGPL
ncbi:hypothetical protein OF83DRAFT_819038 [Amylostereum chailletii]|nr:hypothetical protein OF83DRAFT_819038 [Amylostereum chailletii]